MIPHNEIISQLEKELTNQEIVTQTNVEYSINGRDGECDLYGFDFKNKILYIFEVKTHDSPKSYNKVKVQLDKDEEYLRRLFFDFEPFKIIKNYCFNKYNKIIRKKL